jgi:zinc protease
MKKQYSIVLFFAFFLFNAALVAGQTHFKDLKFPTLNDVKMPTVERLVLENGLVVFLLEDHELPTVSIAGRIRFHVGDEPADKIGLRAVTAGVMRNGGSKTRSADEIDLALDNMAASVNFGIGNTSGSFGASSMTGQWEKTLAILLDLLQNPAFPEDKIELKKIEMRSLIARRNDEPFPTTVREFYKLVYGPASPYARQTEYATIEAISRDDVVAFHQTHYRPERMMAAVWGDFKMDEMKKQLTATLGTLKKGEVAPGKIPETPEFAADKVNLIAKPDVNQSVIFLGHLGGLMSNPDYFALEVMNKILGGGFASRLFKRVRSDQGLAYSVFGAFSSNFDYNGTCYFGCSTKSGNTYKGIKSLLHEIDLLRREEVTDEELHLAKEMYLNSFVFNFDNQDKIINRLLDLEYFGYPKDFLDITKKNIEKVTKADVLRVAQKYLQPDKLKILVLGNPKDFDGKLEDFGPVKSIDITIPPGKK